MTGGPGKAIDAQINMTREPEWKAEGCADKEGLELGEETNSEGRPRRGGDQSVRAVGSTRAM